MFFTIMNSTLSHTRRESLHTKVHSGLEETIIDTTITKSKPITDIYRDLLPAPYLYGNINLLSPSQLLPSSFLRAYHPR